MSANRRDNPAVHIVDPQPWLRRERDARLARLRSQVEKAETDEECRNLRKEMRRAHRDYRRALLRRYLERW